MQWTHIVGILHCQPCKVVDQQKTVKPQFVALRTEIINVEANFRAALTSGKITGDCVKLDANGNEIRDAFPTKTIFDV